MAVCGSVPQKISQSHGLYVENKRGDKFFSKKNETPLHPEKKCVRQALMTGRTDNRTNREHNAFARFTVEA